MSVSRIEQLKELSLVTEKEWNISIFKI